MKPRMLLNFCCAYFVVAFIMIGSTSFAQQRVAGKAIKSGIWNEQEVKYIDGEIAIKIKEGVSPTQLNPILSQVQAKIKQNFDELRWGWVELPEGTDIMPAISRFQKSALVEVAEPNVLMRTALEPNDPFFKGTGYAMYPHQWALKNTGQSPPSGTNDADIDAPEAWGLTTGSSSVIIAILDSGIPMWNGSLCHPDLNDPNKIILGPDYVDPPGTEEYTEGVRDRRGHGTHVAGIAAAETNNSTGIAGVAWYCKLMIIQVFDAYGSGPAQAFYNGVKYAVDYYRNNPTKRIVINFSAGTTLFIQQVLDAVIYANTYGVTLVASAGNNFGGAVIYPAAYSASYSNVIAVSSTDHNDTFSTFSSAGSQVNVAAPGGFGGYVEGDTLIHWDGPLNHGRNIYSTTPNYSFTLQYDPEYYDDPFESDITQGYGYLSGTSMAAPHVAGTVALMLSLNPSLTPVQIRNTLQLSADKVPGMGGQNFTNKYGYGRINANKAVRNLYVPQEYPTISSALNAAISGDTVVLASGTYTGNISMKAGVDVVGSGSSSTILNGDVAFYYDDGAGLEYLTVNGLMSVNYSDAYLSYVNFGSSGHMVITGSNISAPLNMLTAECSQGWCIDAISGTSIVMEGGSFKKKSTEAFYFGGSSDGEFYNTRFCQNNLDIHTDYASQADLDGCTFSSRQEGNSVEGNVYWDDWDYCRMGKAAAFPMTLLKTGDSDPIRDEYKALLADYRSLTAKIRKDKKEGNSLEIYASEINDVVAGLKEFIEKNETSQYALLALGKINTLLRTVEKDEALAFYLKELAKDEELEPYAVSFQVQLDIKAKDETKAIKEIDNLLKKYPEHVLVIDWLYSKGIIYKYGLEEPTKAEAMFKLVIEKYPDRPTAESAREELEGMGQKPLEKEVATTREPGALSVQNYPNPFNPETTIQFTLPEQGRVTLKIFDVMGREVKTLVDEERFAGPYTALWDGKDTFGRSVASGMYFYQIRFKDNVLTKKFTLMR